MLDTFPSTRGHVNTRAWRYGFVVKIYYDCHEKTFIRCSIALAEGASLHALQQACTRNRLTMCKIGKTRHDVTDAHHWKRPNLNLTGRLDRCSLLLGVEKEYILTGREEKAGHFLNPKKGNLNHIEWVY